MLDWLTTDQQASYSQESHIPDAPETPAPLFAYRALRAAVFGSPDQHSGEEEDETEKVNTRRGGRREKEKVIGDLAGVVASPSSHALPQTPPRRGKPISSRSSNTATNDNNSVPLLSPHANIRSASSPSPRKTNHRRGVSPAKSILRTPGIPTPRRQNINVTFKDVQLSVSPITKLRGGKNDDDDAAAAAAAAAAETRCSTTAAAVAKIQSTVPPSLTSSPVEQHYQPIVTEAASSTTTASSFDLDAYMKRTDREMKKLVRYGQRMREFAQHSTQENAVMQRELEVLKSENQRLRRKVVVVEEQIRQQLQLEPRESKLELEEARQQLAERPPKLEIDEEQQPQRSKSQRQQRSSNAAQEDKHAETKMSTQKPDPNSIKPNKTGRRAGRTEPNGNTGTGIRRLISSQEENPPNLTSRNLSATATTTATTTTTSATSATSAPQAVPARVSSLRPDRLAAAKERLRVKSEERKKALLAFDDGGGDGKKAEGDEIIADGGAVAGVESSQVDWQGL